MSKHGEDKGADDYRELQKPKITCLMIIFEETLLEVRSSHPLYEMMVIFALKDLYCCSNPSLEAIRMALFLHDNRSICLLGLSFVRTVQNNR